MTDAAYYVALGVGTKYILSAAFLMRFQLRREYKMMADLEEARAVFKNKSGFVEKFALDPILRAAVDYQAGEIKESEADYKDRGDFSAAKKLLKSYEMAISEMQSVIDSLKSASY